MPIHPEICFTIPVVTTRTIRQRAELQPSAQTQVLLYAGIRMYRGAAADSAQPTLNHRKIRRHSHRYPYSGSILGLFNSHRW